MQEARVGRSVGIIFIIAVVVRIAAFIFLGPANWNFGDAEAYRNLAENLAQGKGFQVSILVRGIQLDWWNDPPESWYLVGRSGQPTMFYEPVFPLILAASYKLFGSIADSLYIAFQIIFGAWTCVLVYFLGRRIATDRGARWAGIFAGVYPSFVFYSIVLMTDMLFFFLLLLTLLQGFRYHARPTFFNLVLLAFLLAITTLTRSVAIVAVPMAIIGLLAARREWPRKLRSALLFALVMGAFFGTWMARNYRVFHTPSLLPTKGAYNLWDTMACLPRFISDQARSARFREQIAQRWDAEKVQNLYPEMRRIDLLFLPTAWADTEPARARQLTRRTFDFMRNNMLFSARRYLQVAEKMYLPFRIETESRALQVGQGIAYIAALLGGFWGWLRLRQQHPLLNIVAISLLLYGVIVPIYSIQNSQRSRMPFDIILIWLAAYSFDAIFRVIRGKTVSTLGS